MLKCLIHLSSTFALCSFVASLQAAPRLIVDTTSELELISADFELADGPAWDGSAFLYFPDVKGGKLHRYNPRSKKVEVVMADAGRISASYYNHGKLFLSDNGNSGIAWLKGREKVAIAGQDPNAKPPARPNDLVVDKHGGVFYTLTRQGQVIYIDRKGKQSVAVEKIETPNGIALSPDGGTLYVAAYAPKKIWAYDVGDGGKAGNGRILAVMDDGPDKGADGMTVDRAGNVYCAGAKDVWIWSPSGKLLAKIRTPERPINCAFGDSDMRSLYITGFGGLYRQRMNAYGVVPHPPSTATLQPKNEGRPSTVVSPSVTLDLDVVYGEDGDRKLLADIARPAKGGGKSPAIVVVHGGGWLNGDKAKFRALTLELARRGYVTMSVGYRLGHEAKFPAGIHDCNAAVRCLRANAARLGVNPNRIGAVGGSAGGHLVGLMATGSDVKGLLGDAGNAKHSSRLQAAIVMAGPMQIASGSVAEKSRTGGDKSNANHWIGKTIDQHMALYKLADAYEHISMDDPPILFMRGEHDKPEANQPSRDKLKDVGVWTGLKVYTDGKHGCWNRLPWFETMVVDMDAFFQEQMK
jgi:gluconolactonase